MPALWEAGGNPALPRNCKRGNRKRSLGTTFKGNLRGTTWEGRLQQLDAGLGLIRAARILTREARRPA